MAEEKLTKLMIWAGIMAVITLGVFFGTLRLFPTASVITAGIVAAGIVAVASIAATKSAAVVAVAAFAAAVVATGFAAATTFVAAVAFAAVAVVVICVAAVAAGTFSDKNNIPKRQVAHILSTEALIIFGGMITQVL